MDPDSGELLLESITRHQGADAYPFFKVIQAASRGSVIVGGRPRVLVGSSDYLGLNQDERVKAAAIQAIKAYGSNCSGSRLTVGNLDLHERLEVSLAKFLRREQAIVFPSGYLANVAAIPALATNEGTCI